MTIKERLQLDVSDYLFIRDYLKDRGVDIERYEPVGFELYTGIFQFCQLPFYLQG